MKPYFQLPFILLYLFIVIIVVLLFILFIKYMKIPREIKKYCRKSGTSFVLISVIDAIIKYIKSKREVKFVPDIKRTYIQTT